MFCTKCGKEITNQDKFCPACGQVINAAGESVVGGHASKVGFFDAYKLAFRKYAEFSGRASRAEYWYFFLANFLVILLLGAIEGALGIASETDGGVLASMYNLVIFIPMISAGVRRLHDVGSSGWWLLFPLVNLFMLAKKGQNVENAYGKPVV